MSAAKNGYVLVTALVFVVGGCCSCSHDGMHSLQSYIGHEGGFTFETLAHRLVDLRRGMSPDEAAGVLGIEGMVAVRNGPEAATCFWYGMQPVCDLALTYDFSAQNGEGKLIGAELSDKSDGRFLSLGWKAPQGQSAKSGDGKTTDLSPDSVR